MSAIADKAYRLLTDSMLNEAFDAIEADIVARWREAGSTDDRERLHAEQAALGRIIGALVGHVEKAANEEVRARIRPEDGRFQTLLNAIKTRRK